jgi:hypothetical protein
MPRQQRPEDAGRARYTPGSGDARAPGASPRGARMPQGATGRQRTPPNPLGGPTGRERASGASGQWHEEDDLPQAGGAPLLTLPSMPRVPGAPGAAQRRGASSAASRGQHAGERAPASSDSGRRRAVGDAGASLAPSPRMRANSAARPLADRQSDDSWGSSGKRVAAIVPATRQHSAARMAAARLPASGWRDDPSWEMRDTWRDEEGWGDEYQGPPATARVPMLARYQTPEVASPRRNTRGLLRRASGPWSLARMILGVMAVAFALSSTLTAAGEPAQRYMAFQANSASKEARAVVQEVRPLTSLLRPDQYDSDAQFRLYGPAACSPSVLAEVMTAWGVPNATIGHMIDDLGPHLSPYAGLVDEEGFQVAAAAHHMRADISWHLTYNQVLYLTNTVGIPVIVNFRRDYGYYHYLAGGHFLVVTGGDQQGVSIVDSSEYFIKYLPQDVFDGLWRWRGDGTAMTVVIVPQDYQYTLPQV